MCKKSKLFYGSSWSVLLLPQSFTSKTLCLLVLALVGFSPFLYSAELHPTTEVDVRAWALDKTPEQVLGQLVQEVLRSERLKLIWDKQVESWTNTEKELRTEIANTNEKLMKAELSFKQALKIETDAKKKAQTEAKIMGTLASVLLGIAAFSTSMLIVTNL
jgi:hypothetical protein